MFIGADVYGSHGSIYSQLAGVGSWIFGVWLITAGT